MVMTHPLVCKAPPGVAGVACRRESCCMIQRTSDWLLLHPSTLPDQTTPHRDVVHAPLKQSGCHVLSAVVSCILLLPHVQARDAG
jgi:hypothetical protein